MSSAPEWVKAIVELKPRFLFGLWLLGALILLLPSRTADGLGIAGVRSTYRGWITVATFAAFVFWVVQLVPEIRMRRHYRQARRDTIAALDALSPEEWLILVYCLARKRQTISIEMGHRGAAALAAKGLLVVARGVGNPDSWPHTIPGFIWKHICATPECLLRGTSIEDPRLLKAFEGLERQMHKWDIPDFNDYD